jgi:acetoin:2,6-dichlorophenolindophenol oxidoreductase subunit alpha
VSELDARAALSLLRVMSRIRACEERIGRLKRADEVHGLIHLSAGQEAVAACVCGQLRPEDVVYSGHRAHGHAIAKGMPMAGLLAELMGRTGGVCRGLGGSMHLVDVEHGFLGATGVVGGNIPMAVGSALAARLAGSDALSVVFFGDGAVQSGCFAEAVNLAALWRLPVLLVCENNGFAEFSPRSAHTPVERVSDVVAPWELARTTVDGNDVDAVWDAVGGVLPAVRAGDGPALLECLTHRLRGHYEGDPDRYREAVSTEQWREKDPIQRLQRAAVADGRLTEAELPAFEEAARAEVEAAVATARESPFPDQALAMSLVYAR